MTENEAIKVLENHIHYLRNVWKPYPDPKVIEAIRESLASLEEIQQYRAIGTIEEFKDLKEKLSKIEFIINEKHYQNAEECDYGNYYTCENALMIKDIEEILET